MGMGQRVPDNLRQLIISWHKDEIKTSQIISRLATHVESSAIYEIIKT